ncbi:MAG: LytR/AlgR family response regulator transcription factor [Gemmatimonadaceae bacterium]
MTVRALIVEDEPLARRQLRELAAEVPWLACVGEAEDGAAAVRAIDELRPDLVFLDIRMPELSGLEVLDRAEHEPAVIFTTAFDTYAVSAFELGALDYLLKPFGRERFLAAVERARRALGAQRLDESDRDTSTLARARAALGSTGGPAERIFVRDRGRIVPIPVREIERLEAEDDYVAVYARGRRFLVYLPLSEFERRLDADRFLRVHRSHVVNLDYVAALVPYDAARLQVEMRDGTKLMASRARSKELRHLAI